MKKLYDLAVKTGEYTNNQGETKGRYDNVGACMQSDDGNKFLFIKRTFNPAGAPYREGSESILVNMFAPKDRNDQRQEAPKSQAPRDDFSGEPPF